VPAYARSLGFERYGDAALMAKLERLNTGSL
jgi:hypothetical protein